MSMTNQEADTALILENELRRRVKAVMQEVVGPLIKEEVRKLFVEQKDSMLMEVSIAVGKSLRVIENEGRTPLWETDMAALGFGEVPTSSNIEKVNRNAVHQEPPPV
jgi:hypothetical protein